MPGRSSGVWKWVFPAFHGPSSENMWSMFSVCVLCELRRGGGALLISAVRVRLRKNVLPPSGLDELSKPLEGQGYI